MHPSINNLATSCGLNALNCLLYDVQITFSTKESAQTLRRQPDAFVGSAVFSPGLHFVYPRAHVAVDPVVFDDAVNEAAALLKEADGLVVASPVYYGSANGTVTAFLDTVMDMVSP